MYLNTFIEIYEEYKKIHNFEVKKMLYVIDEENTGSLLDL